MKKLYIFLGIILVLGGAFYFLMKNEKINIDPSNIIKAENSEIGEEEIREIKDDLDSKKDEAKKYEGVEGDTAPPTVYQAELIGDSVDLKNEIYPKLSIKLEDESGFYRVRILIFYHDAFIGYMQDNINSKKSSYSGEFYFDKYLVLEGYKTLKDYEGAEISYRVVVWDNNMNITDMKSEKNIKIVDNTKPREAEIYWTYYYSDDEDIEMYSKERENSFLIYPVPDLPNLKENCVVKYQYGILSDDETLLFRAGVEKIEGDKKRVTLNIDSDGKYKFFTKTIDKNGNEAEKRIRFNIDMTPPYGDIKLLNGLEYSLGESIDIYLQAKDDLSGVFRYRFGKTKLDMESSNWEEYTDRVSKKAAYKHGVNSIWYQFQDNAFNVSKPKKISYMSKESSTFKIEASEGDKQNIIELDKRKLERGKMEIVNIEEK